MPRWGLSRANFALKARLIAVGLGSTFSLSMCLSQAGNCLPQRASAGPAHDGHIFKAGPRSSMQLQAGISELRGQQPVPPAVERLLIPAERRQCMILQERQQAQRYNRQRKSAAGDGPSKDATTQQERAADDGTPTNGGNGGGGVAGVAGVLHKLKGVLLPVAEGDASTAGSRSGRIAPQDVETGHGGGGAAADAAHTNGGASHIAPSMQDVRGLSNAPGQDHVK